MGASLTCLGMRRGAGQVADYLGSESCEGMVKDLTVYVWLWQPQVVEHWGTEDGKKRMKHRCWQNPLKVGVGRLQTI